MFCPNVNKRDPERAWWADMCRALVCTTIPIAPSKQIVIAVGFVCRGLPELFFASYSVGGKHGRLTTEMSPTNRAGMILRFWTDKKCLRVFKIRNVDYDRDKELLEECKQIFVYRWIIDSCHGDDQSKLFLYTPTRASHHCITIRLREWQRNRVALVKHGDNRRTLKCTHK